MTAFNSMHTQELLSLMSKVVDPQLAYWEKSFPGYELRERRMQEVLPSMRRALENRADPSALFKNLPLILVAVEYKLSEIAQLLVDYGADLSARGSGYASVNEIARTDPEKIHGLTADEIHVQALVGGRCLTEAFNFVRRERFTFWRDKKDGPTVCAERTPFAELEGDVGLMEAFARHKKRGGTVTETQLFTRAIGGKLKLN